MAKSDHVCAEYRGNYRGNSNFIWANTLPADSDNDAVTDSSEWITPEDIHQMFACVPHIISKSKNNMKSKGNKLAVPRNHAFFAIDPENDQESYEALKKLLHKHYPFFDPKALDVGRYLDDAEEELKRMEEFRKAQAEIEKKNPPKPTSQVLFKVV